VGYSNIVSSFKWENIMLEKPQPVAWIFYNPDNSIRFVIHNKNRMVLWKNVHQGSIAPLYTKNQDSQEKKPIAWAFLNPDKKIKFVLDDENRALSWAKHYDGEVVPLYS
jgi:hypothetical protein